MKNNKSRIVFFLVTILIYFTPATAQNKIEYGSNNGKYLNISGIKIYYEEYGKGTPLLVMHGGISSISGMATVIPDLARHFRVIVYDAPGEGRSEYGDTLSIRLLGDYATAIVDALNLDSVYVYGYSLSGIAAMQLALNRPGKVKMLVLQSTVYDYDGFGPGFGGDKITPEIMEGNPKFWLTDHLKKTPQKDKWKKYLSDFNKIWSVRHYVSEEQLSRITCPVLILQGDRDLIKIEHSFKIYSLMKNGQLAILPNTTHFAVWEKPALVSKTILDFLLKKGVTGTSGI